MISNNAKKIIQNIISGAVIKKPKDSLTAARNLLCASFATNTKVTRDFESQQRIKKEQEQLILNSIGKHSERILQSVNEERYLTEGGEAKIYFSADNKHVVKLNDAVY